MRLSGRLVIVLGLRHTEVTSWTKRIVQRFGAHHNWYILCGDSAAPDWQTYGRVTTFDRTPSGLPGITDANYSIVVDGATRKFNYKQLRLDSLRHQNRSCIIACNSLKDLPPSVRHNADYVVTLPRVNWNHLRHFYTDLPITLPQVDLPRLIDRTGHRDVVSVFDPSPPLRSLL